MGYKGGDLDLRTPPGVSNVAAAEAAAPAAAGRALKVQAGQAQRSAPVWVDDLLMACCNQAFDLAAMHRAEHVGLEHLIHALTVVPGAVAWLEQQGVGVGMMRRDTAAMVAAEIPVVLPPGNEAPRRSAEFERMLQAAAQQAYVRQRPASIGDLLSALLDGDHKSRAIALLRQHTAGTALAAALQSASSDPRRPRGRVRVAAVTQQARAPSPSMSEPATAQDQPTAHHAAHGSGASAWSPSDQAIALIEQGALVPGPYSTEVAISAEGLRAIESFDRKFAAIEDALSAVVERLAGVEHGFQGKLGREVAEADLISMHLAAVEQALAALPAGAALKGIDDKFETLEARSNDVATSVALMDERLAAVETAAWAHKGLSERLHAEVSSLSESIGRQRGEITAAVTDPLLQSIAAVDANIGKRLAEGVGAVARISDRLADAEAALRSEIETLSSSLARRDEGTVAATTAPLLERIGEAEANLAERQMEGFGALEALSERLAQIEAGIATLSRQSPDSEERLATELERVESGLGTVNVNQQTIAQTMDRWREATATDLGNISERLEGLERLSARSLQFIEALVLSVQDLHFLASRSEERRNWLGKLLFGMDDAFEPQWTPGTARPPRAITAGEQDGDAGWPSSVQRVLGRLRRAIGSR